MSVSWSAKTRALALTSLKILAREKERIDELFTRERLSVIVELAELSTTTCSNHLGDYESKEDVEGTYM